MSKPHSLRTGPAGELLLPAADAAWLAPLLDVHRMAATLTAVKGPGAPAVTGCAVSHVRYRPGASCTVLYRVELQGADPEATCFVYARALAPGRGLPPLASGVGNPGAPGSVLLAGPVRLPDCGTVLREFPVDATLPWLPSERDLPRLARALVAAVAGTGARATGISFDFKQLRYKPEHRLLLRARLGWREAGAEAPSSCTCQVRFEYDVNRERRADISAQLIAALPSGGLLAPPGLELELPDLNCALVEWKDGTDLSHRLRRGDLSAAAGAGRVLATIAGLTLQGLPRRSPAHALQDVDSQIDALRRHPLREGLAARFDAVMGPLAALPGDYAEGLVHGDYHQGQLLDQRRPNDRGERYCLVDWDRAHYGDPASDYGRFLAQLHLLELTGKTAAAPLATAFRAAHTEGGGQAPTADHELFWTGLALVNLSLRETRRLRPGWEQRTDALLDRAILLLQRKEGS